MVPISNHLHHLVELAKEPSSERRRELMREVTDLFLDDPTGYSENENAYFGDILSQVAKDVETALQAELAERLADVPEAPGHLIRQLVDGEIEVADPLLKRSKALSEEDLLEIVRSKGSEHAMAVSQRDEVSEDLSEALVETGNNEVMVSLVENEGAKISRQTMEKVVDRSENIPALQKPLVNRADLPPDLMNDMFFQVSNALKEKILERNESIDPEMLEQALAASQARVTEAFEQKMSTEQRRASFFVDDLVRKKALTERVMVEFLNNKEREKFLYAFAKLTDLDPRTAGRILANPDYEAMAVASKAVGFDRSTFSTLILKTGVEETRQVHEADALIRLYDKVPPEVAQRTMRFWRVRQKVMEEHADDTAAA